MAENNWVLQDGRVILVEFTAPQAATNWGWFGNRSSGEGLEFATPATAWTLHDWLVGRGMIQAAEVGGGSTDIYVTDTSTGTETLIANVSFTILDTGTGTDSSVITVFLLVNDISSGIDSILLIVSFLLSDIGTGIDIVLPDKEFWIIETGTGLDTTSIPEKEMSVVDSGYGIDDILSTVLINILEGALGSDTTILNISLLIDDSGLSADVIIVTGDGILSKKRLRMRMGIGL